MTAICFSNLAGRLVGPSQIWLPPSALAIYQWYWYVIGYVLLMMDGIFPIGVVPIITLYDRILLQYFQFLQYCCSPSRLALGFLQFGIRDPLVYIGQTVFLWNRLLKWKMQGMLFRKCKNNFPESVRSVCPGNKSILVNWN